MCVVRISFTSMCVAFLITLLVSGNTEYSGLTGTLNLPMATSVQQGSVPVVSIGAYLLPFRPASIVSNVISHRDTVHLMRSHSKLIP